MSRWALGRRQDGRTPWTPASVALKTDEPIRPMIAPERGRLTERTAEAKHVPRAIDRVFRGQRTRPTSMASFVRVSSGLFPLCRCRCWSAVITVVTVPPEPGQMRRRRAAPPRRQAASTPPPRLHGRDMADPGCPKPHADRSDKLHPPSETGTYYAHEL